jgi:hypothetical protein
VAILRNDILALAPSLKDKDSIKAGHRITIKEVLLLKAIREARSQVIKEAVVLLRVTTMDRHPKDHRNMVTAVGRLNISTREARRPGTINQTKTRTTSQVAHHRKRCIHLKTPNSLSVGNLS